MKRYFAAFAVACALVMSGCATAPGQVDDPFEASNRVMFKINEPLIEYVAKQVADFYTDVFPDFFRTAVSNYVQNIDDLFSIVNDALQGKWEKMGNDMGRVIINTGFGFGGLIDIASEAGIPRGALQLLPGDGAVGAQLVADARVQALLERFQITHPEVDLSHPRSTSHAVYWYNLHVVLVHRERWTEVREEVLEQVRQMIERVCRGKGYTPAAAGANIGGAISFSMMR